MKTLKWITPVVLVFTILFATSCSKDEGFEGKKNIKGVVTYPGGFADGAIITVAFGESNQTSQVDFRTVAGSGGAYSFKGLEKGDYFMDATYTDPLGFKFEHPGIHVTVENTKEDLTINFELQ